jgi:hypothetical protein
VSCCRGKDLRSSSSKPFRSALDHNLPAPEEVAYFEMASSSGTWVTEPPSGLERSIKQRERGGWARSGMGILAERGMTAFEMETVESCRSLGIVPADLFRPSRSLKSGRHVPVADRYHRGCATL